MQMHIPASKLTLFVLVVLCIIQINFIKSFAAQIESHTLTLDNGVVVTDTKPKTTTNKAILLVHGWTGNKDEVGNLYLKLAYQLALNGVASVRLDVRGEGGQQTEPLVLTSTYETRGQDVRSAFTYMRQQYPDHEYGLVGFSLGGTTVLDLLNQELNNIKYLILWSSLSDPGMMFRDFSPAFIDKINKQGQATLKLWATLVITKKHYLGYPAKDLLSGLKNFKGYVLSIRGTKDSVPPQENKFEKAFVNATFVASYIAGSDHVFNVLDENKSDEKILIDQSVNWITNN